MKIAIIVRVLWPGGVQRIAFAESEGLSKLGNEVDLIFIRSTNRFVYDSKINYKIMYDYNINKRLLGKIFKRITLHYSPQRGDDATIDIDLIYKTEHKLNKKYDLIYYVDEFSAFFQKYNKKKYKNKTAVIIHEVALFDGSYLLKYIQKRAIKNADIVLTSTNRNLQILKNAGIKNSYVVYPGLVIHNNIPKFEERENIAISVTMWDFGRHPEVLVEIGKHITNGKLIIAGSWTDINYLNKINNLIKDNNLQNKIIVTGEIDENVLIQLYKKSKVSIRFGYNEKGPGMGSLESISWGLPLIINEEIGIKEIINDNINGYVVKETDYEKIAILIDTLFIDKNKWYEISNNNVQLAKELSWENHCKLLDSILKKIV
jgi:glycosyltransferase involved in cell wall biosynthesis